MDDWQTSFRQFKQRSLFNPGSIYRDQSLIYDGDDDDNEEDDYDDDYDEEEIN